MICIRIFRRKLEYPAVYGGASMAAFRQLSTHIVPPPSNVREARLNTHGQKFDRESLYEPIKFETEPIFGQQISILDPSLHWIRLLVRLGLNLNAGRGRSIGPATNFFCHGRTET